MTMDADIQARIAELPILVRRGIEAEFARGMLAAMSAEMGEAEARRVLGRAVVAMAKQGAASMAAGAPEGPSLQHFKDIQRYWTAEDALRIDPQPGGVTELNFNVTRCRYAEMYRAMGLGELGALLSCNRDGAFSEGYDPRLRMTRTQTLMQGASHCDFRYRWVEGDSA